MIKAVFFDMDGTVMEPNINWRELRRQLGVPLNEAIMDYVIALPPEKSERAEAELKRMEFEASAKATPTTGVIDLLTQLRERGIKVALITNNHREAMACVVARLGFEFDLTFSREDGVLKPAPDLLLAALRAFNLKPTEACFVGDGTYDHLACKAADIEYIHLSHEANRSLDGVVTIHRLDELWDHLGL